jgi:hypothetical protein
MFRVASWNMHQQASSWAYLETLRTDFAIDVFLLQEAGRPDRAPGGLLEPSWMELDRWKTPVPEVKRRHYCSVVLVPDEDAIFRPRVPTPLSKAKYGEFVACHPGQFAVAELTPPGLAGERLTLISLYGIWEDMKPDNRLIYAEATLHRAISDFSYLSQEKGARNVIVAGDLNIWHNRKGEGWPRRFDSVFHRLEASGLSLIGPFRPDGESPLDRCPCADDECRHVNTYRYQRNPANLPHQNDFVFASKPLAERQPNCFAVMDEDVWKHSDHRPVIAEWDF